MSPRIPVEGDTLEIVTSYGSNRFVRLENLRFIDATGEPVDHPAAPVRSWRFATADECAAFDDVRLTHRLADECELHGAPRVATVLSACGLGRTDRDDAICHVADELRRRGKDGLASQTLAFRWDGEETSP